MVLPLIIGGGLAVVGIVATAWAASNAANAVQSGVKDIAENTRHTVTSVAHDATRTVDTAAREIRDLRRDAALILTRLVLTVDHIGHNLTETVHDMAHSCAESLSMFTDRISINVDLLTKAVCAFFITCSLGLLLHLTHFSPFLRTIVWFMFASHCLHMLLDYFRQSNMLRSSQKYTTLTNTTMHKRRINEGDRQTTTTSSLAPNDGDINILLLGETGVGKSTFINALVNYLAYQELSEALRGDLSVSIPASFVITDAQTFKRTKVLIGQDSNELWQTGQSSTQACRSYVFPLDGKSNLRIIDTPGIGDTRGLSEDTKNFQNIMACINNYHHLNGICLLLKPNESRLTVFFRFCIKELLTHLHRSAANNIIFCFTNARSTFYSPGETAPLLEQLLKELKEQTGVDVPFAKQNTFCFDNESFRFVAACKQGIQFDDSKKAEFEKSWDTSVEQASNLIVRIRQCTPHRVKDTISLNEARRLIYELTRPIAEIATNIQTNISVIQERMAELNNAKISIAELGKKLRIPAVDLESTVLSYPRTVCTAVKCTERVTFNGVVKIDYKTHCHEHCYLEGVAQNVANNSALTKCSAMNSNGMCNRCHCSWVTHMHITYETKEVAKETIDNSIQTQITTKEQAAQAICQHQQTLEQRILELKQEQATLTSTCAKLSKFLHENSITPYNDDLIKYVEHLVRQEENKRSAGANNQTIIDGLNQMITAYQQEMKIYKEMLNSSHARQVVAAPQIGEIHQLIDGLYRLPHSGAKLKHQIDIIRQGYNTAAHRYETVCKAPKNKTFLSKMTSPFWRK